MSNRTGRLMALVAIALPMLIGCATNSSQVRLRSAQDLDCDAESVSVKLTERPYVGVTRFTGALSRVSGLTVGNAALRHALTIGSTQVPPHAGPLG